MKRTWILGIVCLLIVLIGVATLHYNFGPDAHHIAWAKQRGLPPPSKSLFTVGALLTIAGSAAGGYVAGRSRPGR